MAVAAAAAAAAAAFPRHSRGAPPAKARRAHGRGAAAREVRPTLKVEKNSRAKMAADTSVFASHKGKD